MFLLPRPLRLLAAVALTALATALSAQPQPPPPTAGPGRAYFYTEPGFRGEVFVVDAGQDVNNLASLRDSRGQPFNDRVRSVQLEGPVRVLAFQNAEFRGATIWINGDVPDLTAFAIGHDPRETWSRNVSAVQMQAVGRGVVVFARWERREAERVVRAAYRDILSRDVDGPGLRLYLSRLVEAGWNEEQLREQLRRSEEFKHRDLEAIIRRVYHDVLGRPPDASGIAAYQRSLSRGMTESEMREDLRRSREGAEKQVALAITRAYREILRRDPDPDGLKSYTELMQRKGWTEEDVRNGLRRSEEFRQLPRR